MIGVGGESVIGRPGEEHWARKGEVDLFLWRKRSAPKAPVILFVHGSSMSGVPTFDLQVTGRADTSAMDWFASRGFDTWCIDMEGYGRSGKNRPINFDIANGADDIEVAVEKIVGVTGQQLILLYGVSSGSLRAALYAQRRPHRVARLALDAFVWTGKNSRTLEQRRTKISEYLATNRRPISKEFIASIFTRDHPGCAYDDVVEALADAVISIDESVPTGSYVDMCTHLPLVDPLRIPCPTLIMRGEYDGIASEQDIIQFFNLLPTRSKELVFMPGISHASFQEKNYAIAYHSLFSFFARPNPIFPEASKSS